MNGAMVRATLSGVKTQTRRIIKLPPSPAALGEWQACTMGGPNGGRTAAGHEVALQPVIWHTRTGKTMGCPHGQPGDRLWVRESFWGCDLPGYGDQPCVVYDDEWSGKEYAPAQERPWARKFGRIPSIHMPRDCSRILLEIVSVRVELLHDCSEADALAEGVKSEPCDHIRLSCEEIGCCGPTAKGMYAALWDQINGAGNWAANPWVWVIEFKRVTP
jgi:hypothetical protein